MTFSNRGNFGGNRNQSFGRRDGGDRGYERQMFDAVCAKCGRDCKVPFRPNGTKEVFCSQCFEANGGYNRDSSEPRNNYREAPRVSTYFADSPKPSRSGGNELEAISAKLDKIIKLLTPKEEVVAKEMTQKIVSKIEANLESQPGLVKKTKKLAKKTSQKNPSLEG